MNSVKESFQQILQGDVPVLVDFFATWCGPCKQQSPILTELSKHYADKVRIIKIDIDKNVSAAQKYQVKSVPTLIIFKKGIIKERLTGLRMKGELVSLMDRLID